MKPTVKPLSWLVFEKVEQFEASYDGESFQAIRASGGSMMECGSIPCELFAREISEINSRDSDELLQFVTQYGVPVNPLRYSLGPIWGVLDRNHQHFTPRIIDDITGGDFLDECFRIQCTDSLTALDRREVIPYKIGLGEIEDAVSRLQAMTESVLTYARAESLDELSAADVFNLSVLDFARAKPSYLSLDSHFDSSFDFDTAHRLNPCRSANLTHAICNQMMDFLTDDATPRRCKNGKCGRWFKRKRGASSPRAYSDYCSRRCEEAETKWRQRNPGKVRGWMLEEKGGAE